MPPKKKALGVSVLVPWRETPERAPLWGHLRARWERLGWQVVEGDCGEGPWRKGAAVADALSRAEHDLLVVADADVWTEGVAEAVNAVNVGARWAIPHNRVLRLTPKATLQVLELGKFSGPAAETYMERPYVGHPGGGMVVLTRALYDEAPIDPRFAGWGQEDDSWALALRVLAGRPWRGLEDLWHLYHSPQPRQSRVVGSRESRMLWKRYERARDAARMRALIAETKVPA